ncbi:2-C-methyl-D-erythritol 4-phosphate cytidylyltransferase [Candidatus Aerophobetes bacterium]|nr:2-C-methyl-D-erythritol 4-phosphate cytidylyltransferase [Candidatus Aerophobetes bacterium]
MKVEVVIAGGGRGTRFSNSQPKQFCSIAGKPILDWTLSRFENSPLVTYIILVVPRGMKEKAKKILLLDSYKKLKLVTEGGEERSDSVHNGLIFVDNDTQVVLVHDGVRPLVSPSLIQSVIKYTETYAAVVPGVSVKETIKEKDEYDVVVKTLGRDKLRLIQTPQGFKYPIIKKAHQQAKVQNLKASDDAGLVEKLGEKVKIIPGEDSNIKITTSFDFEMAELLLREEQRTYEMWNRI